MTTWTLCEYALMLIFGGVAAAGMVGFWLGRYREQLALLETFQPET